MRQVVVSGLDIAYRQAGEGSPIVLLHGAYCDSRAWRWQLDGLSDEFTVVAWDAPGCGRSSDPPGSQGPFDYAACLAAFIEAVGLDHPHVLGLSFGAVLALQLYRHDPRLARSLILASAYAGWAGSLPLEVVEQRVKQNVASADLPPDQVVAAYIPGLLTQSAPQGLVDEVAAMMSDFRPVGIKAMTRAAGPVDLRSVLPTIDVPTLLLYGSKDVRSPLNVAEDIHARIPGSRLTVIPDVGHLNNAEAPERFNSEVRAFLRSLQP